MTSSVMHGDLRRVALRTNGFRMPPVLEAKRLRPTGEKHASGRAAGLGGQWWLWSRDSCDTPVATLREPRRQVGAAVPDRDAHLRQRPDMDAGDPDWVSHPSHVGRITTRHVDEFRAWISVRYADHKRRARPRARGFAFFAESAAMGGLSFARTYYKAATVEVEWPLLPFVAVGHLVSGRCMMQWNGGELRLTEGAVLLLPPSEFLYMHDCSESSAITLSVDTVMRVAEETSGLDRAQVSFAGVSAVSPAAERRWLATEGYIQRGLYSRALDQGLLLAAAEEMVAASLLTTFPNTTMTTEVRLPRDPATAATVRRAIAFIDIHAGRPITLSDIAAAAGVVPRTLQYAFRRYRDTTPLAYLRRVRLAMAHEELSAAQPGDGTTVAAVATRWGYARTHRFAAVYREVYGALPFQTLRS